MSDITMRRPLDEMPSDHRFFIEGGREELCHATGDSVLIDGEWWNEYIDTTGACHYGR